MIDKKLIKKYKGLIKYVIKISIKRFNNITFINNLCNNKKLN